MNFCTLFDSHFLPQGLALYHSLEKHAKEFQLFILCMDDEVFNSLNQLQLENLHPLRLADFETDELLTVKEQRSRGEYCWTLTPHIFDIVKLVAPKICELTYLDADLFFFSSPHPILDEFAESGKDILITEHAYAPEYDLETESGRFCVQFITVRYSAKAMTVIKRWQEQCIVSCSATPKDGNFGDQKYLDKWPALYADTVHILGKKKETSAPWNIGYYKPTPSNPPVFYHFHNFRIFSPKWARCFFKYRIPFKYQWVYKKYGKALRHSIGEMKDHGIEIKCIPIKKYPLAPLRYLKWIFVTQTTRIQYLK